MLCSLFLPMMIPLLCLVGYACYMLLTKGLGEEDMMFGYSTTFGIPDAAFPIFLVSLPFVLWFWMFWTGNWRRPVLTALIVYGSVFLSSFFIEEYQYTSPDKRTIQLQGIAGTDVYCNGVLLGHIPSERWQGFTIRVDELLEKVPQWDTPPEQRWYDDSELGQRITTWMPWDNFLKERFEASQELFAAGGQQNFGAAVMFNNDGTVRANRAAKAAKEALLNHDAGCRYWWSFRLGETQLVVNRERDSSGLYRSFDRQSSYYPYWSRFSPSVGFHAQLLADVLPELSPEQKTDWDRHVLKHWSLLATPLKRTLDRMAARHRRDKNESLAELYEAALHSTARMKYNLSDPPTEEECRRLLADWVKNNDYNMFLFSYGSTFDLFSMQKYGSGAEPPIRVGDDLLIPADIREPMRQPLIEQWRTNKFRGETGWAPVAYFSWQDKSPDYFADFARFSAMSGKARIPLLENESTSTATLFKTLLHRRNFWGSFQRQISLYPKQIGAYASVNNPLVEADFRKFVIAALSDPKHNENSRSEVERAVSNAIFDRVYRDNIDKDDLAAWVASLPIAAASKNFALRTLRIRDDKEMTFADKLQQAAGRFALVETDLTLDDVVKWLDENPKESLHKFFEEQEENITVNQMENRRGEYVIHNSFFGGNVIGRYGVDMLHGAPGSGSLVNWLVIALLRSDTSEGDPQIRELIRQIWTRDHLSVEQAILTEYGSVDLRRIEFATEINSIYVPDHLLDLYLSPELAPKLPFEVPSERAVAEDGTETFRPRGRIENFGIAATLAFCESPRAGEILEKWLSGVNEAPGPDSDAKWVNETNDKARPRLERCLEIWQARNAMRQIKMEVFENLIAERMTPDDLLLPQPPWVWKDGEYVQIDVK